jgi:hypothetical protein
MRNFPAARIEAHDHPTATRRNTCVFNGLTSIIREATLLPKNFAAGSGGRMSQVQSKIVTQLLHDWHGGDDEALRAVVPLVYDELRRVAHHYLRKERPDHTLQSAALVHEAYLRLKKQGAANFENRAHFLAICAQLMRQILVEYARSRNTAKRMEAIG